MSRDWNRSSVNWEASAREGGFVMSSNKPGDTRSHIACSLSPAIDRRLTEQAAHLGLSKAALARQVLEEFFAVPSPGRAWELDADHEREPQP